MFHSRSYSRILRSARELHSPLYPACPHRAAANIQQFLEGLELLALNGSANNSFHYMIAWNERRICTPHRCGTFLGRDRLAHQSCAPCRFPLISQDLRTARELPHALPLLLQSLRRVVNSDDIGHRSCRLSCYKYSSTERAGLAVRSRPLTKIVTIPIYSSWWIAYRKNKRIPRQLPSSISLKFLREHSLKFLREHSLKFLREHNRRNGRSRFCAQTVKGDFSPLQTAD